MGSKHYTWPRPYDDTIPHDFIYHRPTRTWLLFLPVYSSKNGNDPSKNKERFWVQFRLDAGKKKVIWHRLVALPSHLIEGEWIYYDDIRDVLIGWQATDDKTNEYKLKFLPDVSKYLWVDVKDSDSKENENENESSPKEHNKLKATNSGGSNEKKSKKRAKSARKPAKSAATASSSTDKYSTKKNKKDGKTKFRKGNSSKNVSKTEKKNNKKNNKNNEKANKTNKEKASKPVKKKDTIAEDEMD